MPLEFAQLFQANNLVLFLALIFVFVLAYKIMQTLIQVSIIAVLSGVFFYALTVFGIGPSFTVSNTLFFTVLGPALYIGYKVLFQFTDLFLTISTYVKKLFTGLWNGLKKTAGLFTSEKHSSSGGGSTTNPGNNNNDDGGAKEKEIILDELKD